MHQLIEPSNSLCSHSSAGVYLLIHAHQEVAIVNIVNVQYPA